MPRKIGKIGLFGQIRQNDCPLQGREVPLQLPDGITLVVVLAPVPISVDGDQHFWLDLPEALDNARYPKLRRARRPYGPNRGRGQERYHGLRDIGHKGNNPVALLNAHRPQPRRERRNFPVQFGIGHVRPSTHLRLGRNGHMLVTARQRMFGIVQLHAGEPYRPWHFLLGEHRLIRGLGPYFKEVPDGPPKPVEVGDRPPPQIVVSREISTPRLPQPAHKASDVRIRNSFRRRLPQEASL